MKYTSTNTSVSKRVFSLLMAALMLLAMMPSGLLAASASAASSVTTVADPETLTRPETIYGDNTANAGKITVGKSVSDEDITVNGQDIAVDGEDNFLVTVSQSAQVTGLVSEINVPLDVVIVFDTSGSMGNDSNGNGKNRTQELVEAANKMINSLMDMNELNRVGVVAFSAHNAGGGTAGYNAANVLSELAHYTGEAKTEHLTWTTGNGPSWAPTVQLVQGRSYTNGQRNSRYGTGGATNIQAGVTLGAQMLTNVPKTDTVVEINGQTITRTPILILMSDGAPTVSAYENEWWNAGQTNNQGPQNAPFMGNGFLTVLTASYYKNAITEHYYGSNAGGNACSFYTVGVELANAATQDTTEEVDLSYMTLNPKEEFATGSDNYYYDRANTADSFLDAWESYQAGEEFAVRVWADQTRHDGYYYFYNQSHTLQNANDYKNGADVWTTVGRTTVQANILSSVKTLQYNDAFYNVADVSKLTDALDDLLTDIARKAITVPTKVTDGNYDFDGYVTFTDPIGEYMEVKDMKGVLADGFFYQGASFAQHIESFGTGTDSVFDELFVNVVKARMNLTDQVVDVDDFIAKAVASENQAYYNSPDDYDNSIVWWGSTYETDEEDEQVQVIGFADNDTIDYIEAQQAAGTIPAGADYVCRSYFFYGEAGGANPDPDHEYLYFMVRVQRELTAPYRQTVVISAPASLLSMETVLIEETFDKDGNAVYTATVEHQEPARVVYEVGLWDSITAENVSTIVSGDYTDETVNGVGSVNYDPVTDTYHFFTNDWDRTQSLDSHHRGLAKATFDAAADNAFYTYQENTLLVDANGDPVTTDPTGTTAYYVREYYEWSADTMQDGTYDAVKKTALIEVDIPADESLINNGGKWYIPKGVYTAATLVVNGDDTLKTENATGTSSIVAHPHRTGNSANSHYTVYLGNNGKLSLAAEPYEPIKTVSVNLPESAVTVTDDEGEAVKIGDVLTYTVEVKNVLAETADITVTDYIPRGTSFVEGSAGYGTDDTGHTKDATVTPDSNHVLTWVLNDVPAGETRYVSFDVVVTSAALSLGVVSDTIDNTATVQLGNTAAVTTNTTHNPPYGKSVTDVNNRDIDGEHGFKVGDTLVYHIRFHNNATDESGTYIPADVTVTDAIPDGTTFLSADNGGVYDDKTGIVTWQFDAMAANTAKAVSFEVKINAGAKINQTGAQPTDGEIALPNTATIVVENEPVITLNTNTTENWADVGDMAISKIVAAGGDQSKTFTIELSESTGLLDGTYVLMRGTARETVTFNEGKATVTIKHGETLTIKGLPAGVILTVTEDVSALPGWTPTYNTRSVTIVKGTAVSVASVSVTNTYTVEPLTVTVKGVKTMNGTLPAETVFGFVAEPDSGNPTVGDPLTGEVTVKASGDYTFTLSPKTFTEPGVYTYTVSEIDGGVKGVEYDTADHALVITVTDNGDGTMSAAATLDGDPFDVQRDVIAFTNTYVPDDVPLTLTAQKTLMAYDAATDTYVNTAVTAGQFRFQVAEKASGRVVTTGANAADGSITFNTFYFAASLLDGVIADAQGARSETFTFVVSEVVPELAKNPNMLYDLNGYEFEATLKLDANGVLSVTVNGDGDGTVDLSDTVHFVNYANPDSVEIRPEGVKSTDNAPSGVSFSFAVINTANGNEPAAGVGDANGSITFSPMSFTQTGTYTYWIKEANAGNTTNGITYDATRYLMKVVVSRNSYNRLVAEVTYWSSNTDGSQNTADYTVPVTTPAFRNEYNAGGYINLTASKVLTGRDLNAGEFAFKLTRQDNGGEIDGIVDADGTVHFSTMYYSVNDIPAGSDTAIIHYVMSEVIPETAGLTGVTYDASTYDVYVKITDNNDGTITPTLVKPDGNGGYTAVSGTDTGAVFTNDYTTVNGDTITFRIKKTLNGRDLREGEFDFLMFRDGALVDIATNNADGIVTFTREIPASTPEGTYELVIREAAGSLGGVSYDSAAYTVYVKVTDDNNGSIVAQLVDADGTPLAEDENGVIDLTDEIEFVNTYVPGDVPVQLEATKTLSGRALKDKEFSFVVRKDTVNGAIVASGSNDAAGRIRFSTFDITAADMAGETTKTFTYVVTESDNRIPGVTVDDTVFTVTVTVTDDGDGALQAVVQYPNDAPIVFENTYEPALTTLPLVAFKTIVGKDLNADEFAFVLVDAADEPVQIVTNAQSGTITFDDLEFTAADMVDEDGNKVMSKTFVYTLSERRGDADGTLRDGMLYDDTVYTIRVTVTDDGEGKLTATASYADGQDEAELLRFENRYTPPVAEVELEGTKAIVDADGNALEGADYSPAGFEFEVCDTDGHVLTDAVSDEHGNIAFTGLTFSAAGEYRYLIREKVTDRAGYTVDPTVWCVHITIGYDTQTGTLYEADEYIHVAPENHDGILPPTSQTLHFVNVYDPADVRLTLKVKKELDGRELHDNEFLFYMVDDATGLRVAEAHNHADGAVELHLSYAKAAEYTYTVYEYTPDENDRLGGVTYSTEQYKVSVSVTDDGTGALKATVHRVVVIGEDTVDMTDSVIFRNTYKAAPADVTVEALKRLEGKALTDEDFTFKLVNTADPDETYTAANTADGRIVFETISFASAGEYVYELYETEGSLGGVTYDTQVYTVTVTVTDDGNGRLHAVTHYTDSDGNTEAVPVFHNTYTAAPVEYTPAAKKIYKGADMRMFDFVLSGEGFDTQIKQNDANGDVTFDTLVFTSAGSYTFTVAEQADNTLDFIRWDENIYTLMIEVADDQNGELVIDAVTVTSDNGRTDLVFCNVHEDMITEKDVFLNGDLSVSIDGKAVDKGDILTYTVSYTNYTGKTADVTITDAIPAHTAYADGSADHDGVYENGVLTWHLTDVAPDATVAVRFDVVVTDGGVTVENQATVLEGTNVYKTNAVTNTVPNEPTSTTTTGTSSTTTTTAVTTTVPGTAVTTTTTATAPAPLSPVTGDSTDYTAVLALLLGSLAAVSAVLITSKKKTA